MFTSMQLIGSSKGELLLLFIQCQTLDPLTKTRVDASVPNAFLVFLSVVEIFSSVLLFFFCLSFIYNG